MLILCLAFFSQKVSLVKSKIWPFLKQSLAFFSYKLLATLTRRCVLRPARRFAEDGHIQSWALEVFLNYFNNKKMIFCNIYQVNLLGVGFF